MRRHHEAVQFFNNERALEYGPTMLEVKVMVAPLLKQVQTLARICFTQRFIDGIDTLSHLDTGAKDLNFQNLLY